MPCPSPSLSSGGLCQHTVRESKLIEHRRGRYHAALQRVATKRPRRDLTRSGSRTGRAYIGRSFDRAIELTIQEKKAAEVTFGGLRHEPRQSAMVLLAGAAILMLFAGHAVRVD